MKKKFHIVLLTVFLTSCASLADLTNLIITPTPPPPPDVTATFAPSETPAPTQNLFATATSTPLTFTPTVTQLGAELFTPSMTPTEFPTEAAPTYGLPPGVYSGTYFTPVSYGFLTILLSHNVLYWNEGPCTPRNVKISAFVTDILATHRVLLFTRLREKKNTLNITDWNSGAIMTKADNGSFNYDLGTDNLRRYPYYKDAWIEYQLVALTDEQEIIGRTQIYDRNLSLVRCMPIR
jgi:hypothetical protein